MKSIRHLAACGVVVGTILGITNSGWATASDDSKRDLKAGDKGTTLESITVEGEDRIRIEFERPKLDIDVDPMKAPGLEWDMMWSLLTSESLDLYNVLPQTSRTIQSPYRPRPWMDVFVVATLLNSSPRSKASITGRWLSPIRAVAR